MNLQLKENLYCAVAICSLGEGTSIGRDCHVAEEIHLNRLAFLTAPRKDVLDEEIAQKVSSLRGA